MNSGTAGTRAWGIVIAAGLIMGAALGVRHAQGLFMQPVLMDQQWTREAFGFAIAIQNLMWGIAQPFTGSLADRYGSGKTIFIGLLLYAIGLLLMAHSSTPLYFTLTNGMLIGLALSGTAFGTVYGALSRIFPPDTRGWALATAGAIGGLGQFCLAPAIQALLNHLLWPTVCILLAGGVILLSPAAILLRENAAPAQQHEPRQPLEQALRIAFRHRGFWLLHLGFFACGFQLAFIATHMPAYLIDEGLSVHHGATALAIIALANVFGMYFAGRSIGIFRTKRVLTHVYTVRALGTLVFISFPVTPAGTYLFAALMGFLWLGTAPLTNSLVAHMYGVRNIGALFGVVFFGHQLGSFIGVWLGGYVYDVYRSYDMLWLISVVIGFIAALLHWAINDRPVTETLTMAANP